MFRFALLAVALVLVHEGSIGSAAAQDNPVICNLVREVIRKELSVRDSKEKGWQHGNSWIWLENPSTNLATDVTNVSLENGRVAIQGRAVALVAFQHKVVWPAGCTTFSGQARVFLCLKASTNVADKLSASKCFMDRLEIHELRLRGDAIRPFQGIIQEGINLLLRCKKRGIERKLEEALNSMNVADLYRSASPK